MRFVFHTVRVHSRNGFDGAIWPSCQKKEGPSQKRMGQCIILKEVMRALSVSETTFLTLFLTSPGFYVSVV